jgi:large subunit ribosomal protein L15
MQLHELPKIKTKSLRRLGQGHGSGRGKTSGRGYKGQKVRNTVPLFFEGGALPLRKRLPFLRGKDRNKVFKKQPLVINVKILNLLPAKSVVDVESLIKARIVDGGQAREFGVKILGEGDLSHELTVKLPVSAGAKAKIEQAGGSVEV